MSQLLLACRVAFAFSLGSLAADAQTPIGPFVGQHSEGFDGPAQATFAPCLSFRVFDLSADACTATGSSGCHTTGSQFFSCLISAASQPNFFSSIDGAVEFSFDDEVERFGGLFGTNQFFPDATIELFDVLGNPLGSVVATFAADCQWHWQGWDFGGLSQVRRIRVSGTPVFSEAFVDMDDLQIDYVGGGGGIVYCTPGTTSNGCTPSISASGNPDLAHASPCQILVGGVEGQKTGLVFYGISGANSSPWCSTGSSLLCVKSPTQRTTVQSSGGASGACDGTLALDWNAFQTANPLALGNPWTFSANAYVQAWFRDPPSCKTTNLSDGVVLTYLP
jgi:hypothetical protein